MIHALKSKAFRVVIHALETSRVVVHALESRATRVVIHALETSRDI